MTRFLIAVLALFAFAIQAEARTVLFASDTANIYRVDKTSGTATLVGPTGITTPVQGTGSFLRDLTSSKTVLYGALGSISPSMITGAIVTIDPMTGRITHTVNLSGLRETGANRSLTSIAYDIKTNTLFGTTQRRLYSINAESGVASFIGDMPFYPVIGLGIDAISNNLFALSAEPFDSGLTYTNLRILSKSDGTVQSSVILPIQCGCDIAFDPQTNQGYLSGIPVSTIMPPDLGLSTLNPDLSSTTFIGPFGSAVPSALSGLAFLGSAVPEPQSWAMMIIGFGVAGCAMRRKRRAVATD